MSWPTLYIEIVPELCTFCINKNLVTQLNKGVGIIEQKGN